MPPPRLPASLQLYRHDRLVMNVGASIPLESVTLDEHGDTVPPDYPIQYVSRNPDVVSVSSSGHVTSRRAGVAWIAGWTYASTRYLSDSVQVSVRCTTEGPHIVVSPPSLALKVGESITPVIVGATICGGHLPFTAQYRWRSHDTSVVTVDSISGRATGRGPGITVLILGSTTREVLRDLLVTVTDSGH